MNATPAVAPYLDPMAKVLTRYGFEGSSITVHLGGCSYESVVAVPARIRRLGRR